MIDLNNEREAFLVYLRTKGVIKVGWNSLGVLTNLVREAGCTLGYNDIELMQEVWMEKAKAQAVPEGYVLIKKEDIENWYLDESEYMWFEADGIDGYLEDIDIGEVVEVQRKEYVVTNSNPVFAAKPWDDKRYCADTWEFFESKDEAEKAAAHCKAMFEASESGAEQ